MAISLIEQASVLTFQVFTLIASMLVSSASFIAARLRRHAISPRFFPCRKQRESNSMSARNYSESIDRCCEPVESTWLADNEPTISEFCEQGAEHLRDELIEQLIRRDIKCRKRSGMPFSTGMNQTQGLESVSSLTIKARSL
ncbi:hypothetical protein OAM37_03245 [bacterium]|nr:hypothetical protein [bacterium]